MCSLIDILQQKNFLERFRWFLTSKIDFESQILALFDTSPLTQFSKFNNFLWLSWFLGKNLSNFVPLLENSTTHIAIFYSLIKHYMSIESYI